MWAAPTRFGRDMVVIAGRVLRIGRLPSPSCLRASSDRYLEPDRNRSEDETSVAEGSGLEAEEARPRKIRRWGAGARRGRELRSAQIRCPVRDAVCNARRKCPDLIFVLRSAQIRCPVRDAVCNARRKCPDLIFVKRRFNVYKQILLQVHNGGLPKKDDVARWLASARANPSGKGSGSAVQNDGANHLASSAYRSSARRGDLFNALGAWRRG